jgi:hypothetical protein
VPDTTDERNGDQPQLGALLELMHRADSPFTTVRATYRIWRHDERATAAWRAGIEEEKRRGASISMFGASDSTPAPSEHEEVLRVWRASDRAREERQGGSRDGSYGVRVSDLWWSWDGANGASSNADDPTVGSGVGEELAVMLDPTPLLSALKFVATGRSQVAHRATITADATPRPSNPRRGPRSFELHQLGSGADRYSLQVDAERGVLLEAVALRDGEPFHKITTVEITFDNPIQDERFHFQPPAGEEVRPIGGRPGPQRLPLPEAQQRAPFTVLIPERIPEDWHVHCVFVERSERPPWPAHVSLNYNSDDGHESVSLSQSSAADRSPGWLDQMTSGDGWEDVVQDGTPVRVTKKGARGPHAQAHLERDGTSVFLMSETLNSAQLAKIAASLKPAPSTSSI